MAIGRQYEDEDSYTLDDEFEDSSEYYDGDEDDIDDEPKEEAPSVARIIFEKMAGIFKPARDKSDTDYDDNEGEDEDETSEYEDDIREERERKKSSLRRNRSSGRDSQNREPEYNQSREYNDEEYTAEELNRYDEKFGTRGSSRRADFKRQTKERISTDGTSRIQRKTNTTSSPSWSDYRGNVRRIIEASPRTMNDIQEIADMLNNDYAAIINFRDMRTNESNAISFLDGVSFIIGYRFERIGGGYYICAPIGFMIPHEFGTYTPKNKR